ncbi:MEDS domain-containing protein [Umezawaea sp.]|uniref:MEDS domain-containing protein n=1 Tax=Umezawaea sp. TaxID=1955258 RepID=UPI002ED64831
MNHENFRHDASVYSDDDEFLAMAVPFVSEGVELGEPVLVTTTPANITLLRGALGKAADSFDHAETAYFGRRPPERATEFFRYWQRKGASGVGRNVRVLAEPLWAGRTESDVRAWRRMESGLNVVLSCTNVWMICPYDTRVVDAEGVAHALKTHPADVRGTESVPSPDYVDPVEYAHACDSVPLPERPPDAAVLPLRGDLNGLRRFVVGRAVELGLDEDRAAMLTVAVGETLAFLRDDGHVAVWSCDGAVVCELSGAGAASLDPFAGFRPPEVCAPAELGEGLWITRQICEAVDVRVDHGVTVFRLRMAGPRSAEVVRW